MTVEVGWDVRERPLTDEAVRAAVEAALGEGGRGGLAVSVALVGDAALAELHGRFLGDPSPTDVMAFDLGEEGGGPQAEIWVSVDRARAVGARRGVGTERELALYLVHGALHLCGLDDGTDEQRAAMRAAEARVLARLGYPADPDPEHWEAGEGSAAGGAESGPEARDGGT